MNEWKTCPNFTTYECTAKGEVRRKDGKPVIMHFVFPPNKPSRTYLSLTPYWPGEVHREIFKAWGPPNPDKLRYTLIDHIDNDPHNNTMKNLRWSNKSLNALNTECAKGWSLDVTRASPYKAHLKWMGRNTTLGRFKSATEAEKIYQECKAWIQVAYREHKYKDSLLVWAWRGERNLKLLEVGSNNTQMINYFRQEGRSFSMLVRHLNSIGLQV